MLVGTSGIQHAPVSGQGVNARRVIVDAMNKSCLHGAKVTPQVLHLCVVEETSDIPGLLRLLGMYGLLAIVVVVISFRLLRQNTRSRNRIYDRSKFTKRKP